MIETGVKTLDLFAPLAKNGTVGMIARPGMGQLVILSEIFYRLKKNGFTTVLLMPEIEHPEVKDTLEYVDVITHTIDEAYEEMAQKGKTKEILFAADRSYIVTGDIHRLQERLHEIGIDSVTTFLMDLKGEAVDEDLPYGPLETLWEFDADLAARYKFPAVNPLYSTSSVLEGAHLDQTHLTTQQRARKLLRRYRELRSLVNASGKDNLPSSEVQTYKRGEHLEAYLTQPFFVAEEFTKQKGQSVGLQKTLKDVRKILDGATDAADIEKLNYIGSLQ